MHDREPISKRRLRLPAGASLYGLASLVLACLVAAVSLDSPLVRLDLAVVQLLHRLGTDDVTTLARAVTELGATTSIFAIASVTAGSLLLRGYWHGAVSVAVSVTATQGIVFGIKALVARGRPPASTAFVDAAGYAFPSAHAASGAALYGLLALFLLRRFRGHVGRAACVLALLAVALLGLTRVYLGAHYPSDVVAGWVVGAAVAAAAWQLGRLLRPRPHVPAPAA